MAWVLAKFGGGHPWAHQTVPTEMTGKDLQVIFRSRKHLLDDDRLRVGYRAQQSLSVIALDHPARVGLDQDREAGFAGDGLEITLIFWDPGSGDRNLQPQAVDIILSLVDCAACAPVEIGGGQPNLWAETAGVGTDPSDLRIPTGEQSRLIPAG